MAVSFACAVIAWDGTEPGELDEPSGLGLMGLMGWAGRVCHDALVTLHSFAAMRPSSPPTHQDPSGPDTRS